MQLCSYAVLQFCSFAIRKVLQLCGSAVLQFISGFSGIMALSELI